MSHEIFHDRFFNRSQRPAWHGLGINIEDDMTAVDAFERVGAYDVTKEAVQTVGGMAVPYYALIREPVPDDDVRRVIGMVTDQYELIPPRQFCEAWDAKVARPVETLGSLKRGAILFISTLLDEFSMDADKVKQYIVAFGPMDGKRAVEVWVTGVRVVCWNTLQAADRQARLRFTVAHDGNAVPQLEGWLEHIQVQAMSRAHALAQAYTNMANTPIGATESQAAIEKVYPWPQLPKGFKHVAKGQEITPDMAIDLPPVVAAHIAEKNGKYNSTVRLVERHRNAVSQLWFDGKATGGEMDTANGTRWGLYNAVSEWESHRRYRGNAPVHSLFGGARGNAIARAYEVLVK